jgi:Lon protease-like protein
MSTDPTAVGLPPDQSPVALSIPLFPLGTVLFPDGLLPLKLFETRYLDMARACFRGQADGGEALPFGVCLIDQGTEVAHRGATTLPHSVGCLAHITDWDMPSLGIMQLKTRGGKRFRIVRHETARDGLLRAEVELIAADPLASLPEHLAACATLLAALTDKAPTLFAKPYRLDQAGWVANRLAEVLPIPALARYKLMELTDPQARLEIIGQFLAQQGLAREG